MEKAKPLKDMLSYESIHSITPIINGEERESLGFELATITK